MAIHRFIDGEYVNNQYVKFETPKKVTTFVGRVFRVYQADYQAMSDVYTLATFAEVLNDKLEIERILVNANFECDRSGGYAEVDAQPGALAIKKSLELMAEGRRQKQIAQERLDREEAEKNRPVKGKKMIVTRGRKVPVGTVGVVAYVKDGSVLLKNEEVWKDRNAAGVWVSEAYLKPWSASMEEIYKKN